MEKIMPGQDAEKLLQMLDGARHITLTCHANPDGDALGSMTAAISLFERLGKQVVAIAPDIWPENLCWLPYADRILAYNKQHEAAKTVLQKTDLVFMMDHNQLSRMNELGEAIAACPAPRVMIDHHLDPDASCCALVVSRPDFCATCEVLYCVMEQMGWVDSLTFNEATSLYTGMMTDTGGFTFASNRPDIFLIISQLLQTGIDKDKIYRNVFFTGSPDRYRLMGYLLYVKMEVMREFNTSIISLTNAERRKFKIRNGETEGMVNIPLQIEHMRLSVFLREDTEQKGLVRVSLRSVDDFPCNDLSAEFFNGGGHKNAAGGRIYGTMDEAIQLVRKAVKKYANLLRN